eukprot:s4446_g5.t2
MVPKNRMKQHKKRDCPLRQIECCLCKMRMTHRALQEHLENDCENEEDCPARTTNCRHHVVGCKWTGEYRYLADHLETCIFEAGHWFTRARQEPKTAGPDPKPQLRRRMPRRLPGPSSNCDPREARAAQAAPVAPKQADGPVYEWPEGQRQKAEDFAYKWGLNNGLVQMKFESPLAALHVAQSRGLMPAQRAMVMERFHNPPGMVAWGRFEKFVDSCDANGWKYIEKWEAKAAQALPPRPKPMGPTSAELMQPEEPPVAAPQANGWEHAEREPKAKVPPRPSAELRYLHAPPSTAPPPIPKAAPTPEAWLAPQSANEATTAEPQGTQAYKAAPASFQVRDVVVPAETPVPQADSSPKAWLDGATSALPRKAPPGSWQSQAPAAANLPKQAPADFALNAPVTMKAPPIPQEPLKCYVFTGHPTAKAENAPDAADFLTGCHAAKAEDAPNARDFPAGCHAAKAEDAPNARDCPAGCHAAKAEDVPNARDFPAGRISACAHSAKGTSDETLSGSFAF